MVAGESGSPAKAEAEPHKGDVEGLSPEPPRTPRAEYRPEGSVPGTLRMYYYALATSSDTL